MCVCVFLTFITVKILTFTWGLCSSLHSLFASHLSSRFCPKENRITAKQRLLWGGKEDQRIVLVVEPFPAGRPGQVGSNGNEEVRERGEGPC